MKVTVCTLELLKKETPLITTINNTEIGIFLDGEEVYAVRNICPHKMAPVCKGQVDGTLIPSEPCKYVYGLSGEVLKCPWHGWEFSIKSGEALYGISNRKLKTYPTYVEENNVIVEI